MALTAAEKQKLYRERQKGKLSQLGNVTKPDYEQQAEAILKAAGFYELPEPVQNRVAALLLPKLIPELCNMNLLMPALAMTLKTDGVRSLKTITPPATPQHIN